MKKNLRLLFIAQLLIMSFGQIVLSQTALVSDILSIDKTENISAEELKKSQKKEFQPPNEIDELSDPLLSQINFDDLNIVTNNSVVIAPNRYAGVSFYHPNFSTWLSRAWSYSPENSLLVGYKVVGYTEVFSPDTMVIEFTRPSKDVAFLWGHDQYYSAGQIEIYGENNQHITTLTLNLGGFWHGVFLNQYSQRIKKLVLRRPSVSNNQGVGHILIDNFQFTPITTASPVGYLDGVDIQQAKAFGWSRDPDDLSASNYVDCYVNVVGGQSVLMGRVLANIPSSDVGNHRFEMAIPATYRDGRDYQLRCYGLDAVGGDPPTLLTGSPKNFKFNAPIGYLDVVTTDGDAFGWAKDLDRPNDPIRVDFYLNAPAGSGGYFIGSTVANIYRADVGNHGFSFSIPPQYRDNIQYVIYAHGIDLTGDQNKVLSGCPKTFQLSPKVSSVTFGQINNEVINNQLTSSELDRVTGAEGHRIFPDKKFPADTTLRKRVRVKAVVGVPNVTVYFRNYDVDDPSDDPIIDDTGSDGNDNHVGRTIGGAYPPFAKGELSSVSAVTNASGEAIVYFNVTGNAGDNFRIAASTNQDYLNGVTVSGTGLKDAANVSLNVTTEAKQTELLTVWRKVHLEVDSMGVVSNNVANGITPIGTFVDVGTNPVWVTLYYDDTLESLDEERYRATTRPDGTIIYGGRLAIGNVYSLQVLDNKDKAVLVRSESGVVPIRERQMFFLFDDDDYNSNDGSLWRGDDGEDVNFRFNQTMGYCLNGNETLSRLCPSSDVSKNPFAVAYIEPEYNWAAQQPGMNDNDVPFTLEVFNNPLDLFFQNEADVINENRDSSGLESNDFWIGYLLLSYQSDVNYDPSEDALFGVAPPAGRWRSGSHTNSVNSWGEVPVGSIGAIVYLETMRDVDTTVGGARRIKTVPHELGHQLGLAGDSSDPPPGSSVGWGLMGYTDSYNFDLVPQHIKVLRFRVSSPGQ